MKWMWLNYDPSKRMSYADVIIGFGEFAREGASLNEAKSLRAHVSNFLYIFYLFEDAAT